jgi:hypothetical protein
MPSTPPPPSGAYSPSFVLGPTGPPFHPTADSPTIKRPPTVDSGMVDFSGRDRRSNSDRPSRFGQGINPPRRPNFAHNVHPIKWCRRSLAHPNRTITEYHEVDHGVAVGRPRRFCFIPPIAFVGGNVRMVLSDMCAVVFAVVLRNSGYFLFHVNKLHQCV